MEKVKLAIIGATGLVGQTFIHILSKEKNDDFDIKLFASKSSKNKKIKIKDKYYVVHELNEESFDEIDYACFFTSAEISKQFIPIALRKNVKVIDNSSAFRMDKNVPLVAFGVNEKEIKTKNLISNPNCCVIQSVIVLNAIKEFNIQSISYNTYQSVSGSGKQGIDDLLRCRKGLVPLFYETDISFTCIPKIGEFNKDRFTDEEEKMSNETTKILNQDIDVVATCVRVPVMFSHGVAIEVKLKEEFTINEIKESKKEARESYDSILSQNVVNEDLRELYIDYIRMRQMNNRPLTNRALAMLIQRCERLSNFSIGIQKRMLENAILNNWNNVYLPNEEVENEQSLRQLRNFYEE